MREEYILQDYPLYFVFGENIDGSAVDVADRNNPSIATLPHEQAKSIIEAHNRVVEKLVETAIAFSNASPDKFNEFWYGKNE